VPGTVIFSSSGASISSDEMTFSVSKTTGAAACSSEYSAVSINSEDPSTPSNAAKATFDVFLSTPIIAKPTAANAAVN